MARVNVYLADELATELRERCPDTNVSKLFQSAVRELLRCRHDRVVCATCSLPVALEELIDKALGLLYVDTMHALTELVVRGGTVEGAARVTKSVAERHRVRAADHFPLPRLSRAEREERQRHPSSQYATRRESA